MNKHALTAFLTLLLFATAFPLGGRAYAANADGTLHSAPKVTAQSPRVNVAIQAGHWKSSELPDPLARLRGSTGAAGGGRTESQVTLDIAQRVARLLRSKGKTVEVLPATVPTGYQADLFISLHADGSTSAKPRGYKVSTRWRSDVAALDALLVQAIEDGYGGLTAMPQDPSITRAMRGYYAYSTYRGEEYRLGASTPAAILEMGFMSNAADRNMMFNNPELVARGVVAGIDKFYSQKAAGVRLQSATEKQAAASAFDRSVIILGDTANIRAAADVSSAKVAGAQFGNSFPLLEPQNNRPRTGPIDPRQGTQVITGSGWYKIALPNGTPAYISRDLVVVQQ
ncbi:MAG TPA: N-acetylmuramoyl-L-alanine amidase [Chloroflexia bacterium]|nr:N-acetylmuramoyl-L-alanine amidase [Chloroflexia bacterium]